MTALTDIKNIIAENGVYHKDRHAYVLGNEPMVFHCHHYNVFLQESVENTRQFFDPYPILVDSAHSVVYNQIKTLKEKYSLNPEDTLALASEIFKHNGFGILEFEEVKENYGRVVLPSEHYGLGWLSKYGERNREMPPVAFFARGFVEGAIAAAYGLPLGSITSMQTKCISYGDDFTEIEYRKISPREIKASPAEGVYAPVKEMETPADSNVDYYAVRDAVLGLPLAGSEDKGLIPAFGVMLTRMYANYYNLITDQVLEALRQKLDEDAMFLLETLLKEAGHVCAFNTLGGIMTSPEWDAVVMPMVKEKKDWIHGIVAVINALGWGVVEVQEIQEGKSLKLKHYSDYENNGLIALKLQCQRPAMFLFQGVNAGIMNLLYNADITQKPTLDDAFYKKVFFEGAPFFGGQERDRRLDGEYSVYVSQRI